MIGKISGRIGRPRWSNTEAKKNIVDRMVGKISGRKGRPRGMRLDGLTQKHRRISFRELIQNTSN